MGSAKPRRIDHRSLRRGFADLVSASAKDSAALSPGHDLKLATGYRPLTLAARSSILPNMTYAAAETMTNDETLAERIARRDDSAAAARDAAGAFEELYQRHASKLLAFLAARVKKSDIEDFHQSIWERIWQHLPKGFQGGNFRAWLYQVARNYLVDQSRKRRSEPLNEEGTLADARGRRPDEVLMEQERHDILRRCLERLSAEAAALVRARLAGEDYDAICQRIALKAAQAHKLFHQAKQQLQACVESQ